MQTAAHRLVQWSRGRDFRSSSFKRSALASSVELLLPFCSMTVRKADEGFSIFHSQCEGECEGGSMKRRCETCAGANNLRKEICTVFQPVVWPAGATPRIDYIANNPVKAKAETIALRKRERKLKRAMQQKEMQKEMDGNGYDVSRNHLRHTHRVVQIMDSTIMKVIHGRYLAASGIEADGGALRQECILADERCVGDAGALGDGSGDDP